MADNNIIIKITSEANLDAAQKQMKELTDRAKEQEQAMRDLSDVEKQDAESIKQLGLSQEQLAKALKKNKDYYRELKDQKKAETAETKKSIKELENQVKAYQTLNGQSGRMVTQLRAMREQLMRMEEAGEFGTEAFMNLSIAAGQLEDQIGDTQQRIRVLASDTKEIDAVMGLGDGLAGSFYIATSAAELFGGEIEGLQAAFYKVQAAMSVVSGVQQVWNALNKDSAAMVVLNTALAKLFAKSKQSSATATTADTAATAANSAAMGAQAAATTTATVAQKGLNAAMKANPIGVILAMVIAAVAAVAALGMGVYKLVHYFSAAGKAQREYAKAAKELEEIQESNAASEAKRAYRRQKDLADIDKAEQNALDAAKERHASSLETAQIEMNYAKQRAEASQRYANDEIRRNNKEVEKLAEMVKAKQREVNAYRDGSKKKKKAEEELKEVTEQYYAALQKGNDIEKDNLDMQRAAADAARALKEEREQLHRQLQQANIDLMKEGAAKEIAQIKLNYKEQLNAIRGGSAEETALRKALLAKQAQEIAAVREKYAEESKEAARKAASEEQQAVIQEQKNLLALMAQSRGTEADYADEIALTKEIAAAEAQARIDALDKDTMSEREYAAQVEAIRLELSNALREIDNREVERASENAQRRTEIAVQEAEARKNAMTGAEGVDEQKSIVADYYSSVRRQIEQNAEIERQAVERSTDTAEVKADKIRQINAQMNAALLAKDQELAQARMDIDDAYVAKMEENRQKVLDGFQTALGYMQQVSDMVFEALGNNVQAELDALDEMYTTDAEEAKKNANKKYISEQEYEKKKAALEMKQAKYAKAQALISAGINTAMAIVTTLAQLGATPWGIAASVIAGAMGAAQMAIIAAKPLAQYEKGRKGGKGEYALVGEKGPELMYVPQGASIVPNSKIGNMAAWGDYGVPKLPMPVLPDVSPDVLEQALAFSPMTIDYDRLGQAVAKAMPKQRAVNVNVDRSGVTVQNGNDTHTYLNRKYNGAWN